MRAAPIFLILLLPQLAQAQRVHWSPRAPYHDSAVQIWQGGQQTASGVLVGASQNKTMGYVLTSYEATAGDDYAGVIFSDGSKSAGKLLIRQEETGLALLTCDPPDNIQPAEIGSEQPEDGEACDHVAYEGDERRSYYGHYLHSEDGCAFSNATAAVMDRGGGVWAEAKLIGIILGGKYVVDASDSGFPVRSSNTKSLREIIDQVNEIPSGEVLAAQASVPPNYFEYLDAELQAPRPPKPEPTDLTPPTPEPVAVPPSRPPASPPAPEPPRTPQRAPQPPQQIITIDTDLIARSVVEHITDQNLMPPQKVDDAEFLIRLADRLTADPEFVRLVSDRILEKIERRVLTRIGNTILQESKN